MAPFDFRHSDDRSRILHLPTGSYLEVTAAAGRSGKFFVNWHVTDGPGRDQYITDGWDNVLQQVVFWAGEVKYVTETPDLWAELQKSRTVLAMAAEDEISNSLFAVEEQAEIAARIEEIKQQTRENPELTAAQISGIDNKLDELVDASKRVGRKDWLVMLYGAAFGMIVNDMVPAHVVQGIITTVITGLGHIFGLGGAPPSLPV